MKLFIVVYDDCIGLCMPMTWDTDCNGALECSSQNQKPVAFQSSAEARKAIRISAKNYALRKEQGKITNDDFSPEFIKNVRIQEIQIHEPTP